MLLLDKYKHTNIIVAHVNYNARKDSKTDETIVRKFCKVHEIPFFDLQIKKHPKSNFQAWAREQRFNFFKSLYDKYQCKALLLGHHKDDFLETAIMQLESKRNPDFFGIKEKSYLDGMKIVRPFIKRYWKDQILQICENRGIPYAIDSTNSEDKYTRNKVRHKLEELTQKEKRSKYQWFTMSNRILVKKAKKVDIYYKKWSKTNFSIFTFGYMRFKNELVYRFLHEKGDDINVTSKKLDSIIDWLSSENSKREYKIKDNVFIQKKNKVISIIVK